MLDKFVLETTDIERQSITELLIDSGFNPAEANIALLAGDGSDRRFLRASEGGLSLVVILPNLASEHGMAESCAARFIGSHLHRCGVPVPKMYGYDSKTGIMVCEDLGDRLLHTEVVGKQWTEETLFNFYEPIIELLAHMQIVGGTSFKSEWCWDTNVYDKQLMLSRESGYFMESCCRQLLGIKAVPVGLQEEFVKLASQASALPGGFFLHRDFQSRNIMVKDCSFRFIDFQGGRFGPLGYDLASLLIDPYVALPDQVSDRLLQKYIDVLAGYSVEDAAFSVEGYYLLVLQRNLQILGAFAFLAKVKNKSFFRDYLVPAALSLSKHLKEPMGQQFPVLRAFSFDIPEKLDVVLS